MDLIEIFIRINISNRIFCSDKIFSQKISLKLDFTIKNFVRIAFPQLNSLLDKIE